MHLDSLHFYLNPLTGLMCFYIFFPNVGENNTQSLLNGNWQSTWHHFMSGQSGVHCTLGNAILAPPCHCENGETEAWRQEKICPTSTARQWQGHNPKSPDPSQPCSLGKEDPGLRCPWGSWGAPTCNTIRVQPTAFSQG